MLPIAKDMKDTAAAEVQV